MDKKFKLQLIEHSYKKNIVSNSIAGKIILLLDIQTLLITGDLTEEEILNLSTKMESIKDNIVNNN